jgi:heme O synthase-like polyprenyltransferase
MCAHVRAGVLAGALYFWQLPHFLSLAWLCRGDYARGGYRMLSVFDPTGRRTAACALRNALYLVPLGGAAACLGVAEPLFALEAAVVSGVLATTAATFLQVNCSPLDRPVSRIASCAGPMQGGCRSFMHAMQRSETLHL